MCCTDAGKRDGAYSAKVKKWWRESARPIALRLNGARVRKVRKCYRNAKNDAKIMKNAHMLWFSVAQRLGYRKSGLEVVGFEPTGPLVIVRKSVWSWYLRVAQWAKAQTQGSHVSD